MPLFGRRSPQDERMLIVFAPDPGAPNARPLPGLDPPAARQLYTALFLDTLMLARRAGTPVLLALAGETYTFDLPRDWEIVQQPDRAFGERIEWSFGQAFARGAKQVVLIGADVPQLPPADLIAAFAGLRDHNAVLGPAQDGGVYLLGLDDPAPWLFGGVDWAAADLCASLIATLERRGRKVAHLPEQHVLRSAADAQALAPLLRAEPERAALTVRALRELNIG